MRILERFFGKKRYALFLFSSEFNHAKIIVEHPSMVIGRGDYTGASRVIVDRNKIAISMGNKTLHRYISEIHSSLSFDDSTKKLIITNKSKNKTFVNGEEVKIERMLQDRDKVTLVNLVEFEVIY